LLAAAGGKAMRRGTKAQLAEAAECQSTYISQVLHGKAQLSPEQAERIARYLKLGKEETNFFMLLVHKERAGSKELKNYYLTQIEERVVQRMNVVNRLGAQNTLSEEQHAIFIRRGST
jgi:transcriptional regulator with XRE-family HTH domain